SGLVRRGMETPVISGDCNLRWSPGAASEDPAARGHVKGRIGGGVVWCLARLPVPLLVGALVALTLSPVRDQHRSIDGAARPAASLPTTPDIHSIQHVIVIMQENRSFDHYFGTYPGAVGFPRNTDGSFAVCNPDPATGSCVQPYHDESLINVGGPHGVGAATADIDGG